jgi:hypothetical protein
LAGLLDRRVALGRWLRRPNAVCLSRIAPIQPEHRAIVRTGETRVEPAVELARGLHVRHALAADRR